MTGSLSLTGGSHSMCIDSTKSKSMCRSAAHTRRIRFMGLFSTDGVITPTWTHRCSWGWSVRPELSSTQQNLEWRAVSQSSGGCCSSLTSSSSTSPRGHFEAHQEEEETFFLFDCCYGSNCWTVQRQFRGQHVSLRRTWASYQMLFRSPTSTSDLSVRRKPALIIIFEAFEAQVANLLERLFK